MTTHGLSHTLEYRAWVSMKSRCNEPTSKSYKNYGGRGITVCSSWQDDFLNFLFDMGEKPSRHHTLDRINNNGNYEPGNCRWATRHTQSANQRRRSSSVHPSSGCNGVYWEKRFSRWRVRLTVNRKRIHIGYYDILEDAILACEEAKKIYYK